jgi:hypothetical protein
VISFFCLFETKNQIKTKKFHFIDRKNGLDLSFVSKYKKIKMSHSDFSTSQRKFGKPKTDKLSDNASPTVPLLAPGSVWNVIFDYFLGYKEAIIKTQGFLDAREAYNSIETFYFSRLLEHVVKGEQDEAEEIIKKNCSFLRRVGRVQDYSGRTIEGTALQMALGAGDIGPKQDNVYMVEMIQNYFSELPDGLQEMKKQYDKQFPPGYEQDEEKRKQEDAEALHCVSRTIEESKEDEDCKEALEAFRHHLLPKTLIRTGFNFNETLLLDALRLYEKKYTRRSHNDNKKNLFWCQVVGYIQRFFPAYYAQAFCPGPKSITTPQKKPNTEEKYVFFPLTDACGLGYDWAYLPAYGKSKGPLTRSDMSSFAMETLSELKTNKDRRISQLGKNLTKYSTKNLDVYKKAAEKGDAEAQYNLGLLYDNGLG